MTGQRAWKVAGVDLSLTATGIATAGSVDGLVTYEPVNALSHISSCEHEYSTAWMGRFARQVLDLIGYGEWRRDAYVVLEGPSLGSATGKLWTRAGLWHVLVGNLIEAGGWRVLVLPPASLKKYATGKGNAGKPEMLLAAHRRLGHMLDEDCVDDNSIDAAWLATAAAEHIGRPLADLPAANRDVLGKLVQVQDYDRLDDTLPLR